MNIESDPTLPHRLAQAGGEIYQSIFAAIADHRGTHLETAIAAAGYLAGTAVLLNCGVNFSALKPGTPVFVDPVNDAGIKVSQYMMDAVANGASSGVADLKAPPSGSVPPDHQPLRSHEDLMKLFWPRFEAIVAKHSIPAQYTPFACANAAAQLIVSGQAQLPPAIGKQIAIEAMVKASKTVPYPSKPPSAMNLISSREEFFAMLARTAAEMDGFATREPAYSVWTSLQRQLHAVQQWTANGADPTPEQLQSINIGLITARELEPPQDAIMEDLVRRLHLLHHYLRNWMPSRQAPPFSQQLQQPYGVPRASTRGKPLTIVLASIAGLILIIILAIAAIGMFGVGKISVLSGIPFGRSVRTNGSIVTLIQTLVPYSVSLHHNPEDERFRFGLFIRPINAASPGRMIPVTGGLSISEFRIGARILGDDGTLLWFHVNEIGALDLKTGSVITPGDLRRANPSLDDIWTDGWFELGQRLIVTTRDYQRVFEVDPATLQAVPSKAVTGTHAEQSGEKPERYLVSGGLLSPTEWFGVHSAAEVARDFTAGSSVSGGTPAEHSAGPRRIYRGRVESTPFGSRIQSMEQISSIDYLHAALVRGIADSQPLRLSGPEGFLLTYTSPPNPAAIGTMFIGTRMVARVDASGKPLWTVDTGIGDLEQILPHANAIAFVGTRPRVQDKVPEPILVIIDVQSGKVSISSLWQ